MQQSLLCSSIPENKIKYFEFNLKLLFKHTNSEQNCNFKQFNFLGLDTFNVSFCKYREVNFYYIPVKCVNPE